VNDGPILICYDGSTGAQRAIDAAAGLLGPRRAVVLDVGPVQESAALDSEALAHDEMARELTTAQAESGAELARNAGFRARGCADTDAPAWLGAVEVADEIGADAIVVGSRGLCGVKALLESSFSRLVAIHTDRPVLVVPPPN
jgi:nucleotide-binding universal stress UspA family protein